MPMDASEKILNAFIFRLALLILAIFAARNLPDNSLQAASITTAAITVASTDSKSAFSHINEHREPSRYPRENIVWGD